jgi:hypothetical protein
VSFAAINFCVASQRVIPKVSVYFVIGSIRKLLDALSYTHTLIHKCFVWMCNLVPDTKGRTQIEGV